MKLVNTLLRTASQFLYFLCLVVSVPTLLVLAWGMVGSSRFLASQPLGLTLGEYGAVSAVAIVTANAVVFLRPDDMADWMAPVALLMLLAFSGLMLLLFVLPL